MVGGFGSELLPIAQTILPEHNSTAHPAILLLFHGSGSGSGFQFLKVRECFANNVFDDCRPMRSKLTWLVLGGDPAARSHRVEQLTAL